MNAYAVSEESTERLRHALEVASTSETTGTLTLEELERQREVLESADEGLSRIDQQMQKSRSVMSRMARRAATSKGFDLPYVFC